MTQFNFGPIARTDAGGTHDTINLAPFPLHVMLNALVGSTSVEEFVAWLWHDLYKPAFHWKWLPDKNKFSWDHVPGGPKGAFPQAEKTFAQCTNIREGLVSTHHRHFKEIPHFALREVDFISDQGEQINLGATVNYLQLSLAAEPALPTLLPRLVIANAFIEVVTQEVARALRQAFIQEGRVPIEQVRFEFETSFSSRPTRSEITKSEIWQKVGKHFDVRMDGNTFIMRHLTPVSSAQHEPFATTFTADLMGKPLPPSEMLDNTLSLAELLVLYQDSRTVIVAVPQSQLYAFDVTKIHQATFEISRHQLERQFNVLTKKDGVDYLKTAFNSQIEIREVPGRLPKGGKNSSRKLNEAVQRPIEMLTEAKNASDGRLCCLTGTWFQSSLPEKSLNSEVLFKKAFVDTEFVGLTANASQQRYLTPLAHLYAINSSGAGKGEKTRKAFRGAFAYLVPASHFLSAEDSVKAVERPPLDFGGRFVNQLSRITVTTQEFTLFQQMSRRIIAKLWQRVANEQPLPLPYLGAIALTQEPEQRSLIKQLLPQLDLLFSEVTLATYPFKIKVNPAIEIGLEVPVHDRKQHHAKHTLLKTAPHLVSVKPQAAIPLLIDDKVQVNLTEAFFMRANLLADIADTLKRRKKEVRQQDLWLKLILANRDPVTAVLESAAATLQTEGLPKTMSLDTVAFTDAEKFWNQHIRTEDFAASWDRYEQLHQSAATALEEFPALLLLLQMVTLT